MIFRCEGHFRSFIYVHTNWCNIELRTSYFTPVCSNFTPVHSCLDLIIITLNQKHVSLDLNILTLSHKNSNGCVVFPNELTTTSVLNNSSGINSKYYTLKFIYCSLLKWKYSKWY